MVAAPEAGRMGGYRGEVGPSGDKVWTFRGSAHYQFHLVKSWTGCVGDAP